MKASSSLACENPSALAASLIDTFREYADVGGDGASHFVRLRYGTARLEAAENRILITAEAEDDIRLSYVKMAVAEHWAAHPLGTGQNIRWDGGAGADLKPVFFQTIEVVAAQMVAPRMKRIRFRGEDFHAYPEGGLHVRLLFAPKGRAPVWPSVGADGRIVWPVAEDTLAARVYTIRSVDLRTSEIEIDFVLHDRCGEAAPGADFADTARPGQVIGIFAPGANEIPSARSLLLAGDETALPAMARIVEALPSGSRVRIFAQVDNAASHYDFVARDAVELTYLYRDSQAGGDESGGHGGVLTRVVENHLREAGEVPDFLWAGCEFGDFTAIRKIARDEWRMPRDRHLVVAYWRKR